jgi:hypothetical protein
MICLRNQAPQCTRLNRQVVVHASRLLLLRHLLFAPAAMVSFHLLRVNGPAVDFLRQSVGLYIGNHNSNHGTAQPESHWHCWGRAVRRMYEPLVYSSPPYIMSRRHEYSSGLALKLKNGK